MGQELRTQKEQYARDPCPYKMRQYCYQLSKANIKSPVSTHIFSFLLTQGLTILLYLARVK
jgi:hypothetical protein